ncbi:MAG: phosphoribosylglycinamide synthetase C domain-containing protein, partial [Oscillospiraceae bacterium]
NTYYSKAIQDECMKTIFMPTIKAMNAENRSFKGCLYFGLMLTKKGAKVIEYNCRFGDPETQVVLPLLESDLLTVMQSCTDGTLDKTEVKFADGAAACVVMASGGYPQKYEIGKEIKGLTNGNIDGATVYHAGTKLENGKLYTAGGRVMGVTATAENLQTALDNAYTAVKKIDFENVHYRNDIGKRALEALK